MKLTIEKKIGEASLATFLDGDYEEVLAFCTEFPDLLRIGHSSGSALRLGETVSETVITSVANHFADSHKGTT